MYARLVRDVYLLLESLVGGGLSWYLVLILMPVHNKPHFGVLSLRLLLKIAACVDAHKR